MRFVVRIAIYYTCLQQYIEISLVSILANWISISDLCIRIIVGSAVFLGTIIVFLLFM